MSIPIDYNKMQAELDRRRYMGQIYTGKVETWQPTELGLKTYGKWCDLVGWKNLTGQKWKSSDDFMNLAIKRKWTEIVYDFDTKENVCKQTKLGYDLFKTFEYWIDEKAQKREVRKKQINGILIGFQKILQGMPKFMQQISEIMASFSQPKKSKSKLKKRGILNEDFI
tara:strand:+ start:120 stop:623 length:504 start_codon:yes stop_codon:yes gene_type:complete